MNKILFILLMAMTTSVISFADDVKVDTSGWDQTKINLIQIVSANLLDKNGITYKSISFNNPILHVDGPSSDVSGILTRNKISDEYDIFKADLDTKNAIAEQEAQAKEAEKGINQFSAIKLEEINTKVDSAASLDDLKTIVKDLMRYLNARNLIGG